MTAKEETLARWPNAQAKQIPHVLDFPLWIVDLTPQLTEGSTIVGDGKTEDEAWAQAAEVARSANEIVGPRPSPPAEEETYSDGEGPECPRCHAVWTADDKEYFDEANGMKMKCSCGAELFIQPETRTTWTTTVVSKTAGSQ